MTTNELDLEIRRTGERILKSLDDDSSASLFSRDTWYRKVMDWSMKNPHFKVQMFRFVDVLPYLQSSAEVARHLKEYFSESGDDLPSVFNFGLGLGSMAPGLMAGAVRKNVTAMAKMFITGETPADALPALVKARAQKIAFTADLLGEAALSEKEAAEYLKRYRDLITMLADAAVDWETIPQIDRDERGEIPKVNVSVKVTALYSQIDESAWDESLTVAKSRVRELFRVAQARGVFVNLDQEQFAHRDFILRVFEDVVTEPEFAAYPHFGIVVQAYLTDAAADVARLVRVAKRRGTPFTIRLVKGAYWDFETVSAKQRGWPVPVFLRKTETDASFETCARALIDAYPHVRLAVGSHNVRSIAAAVTYARARGLAPAALELQMLFGMADVIKRTMVNEGYRLREYATIGELIPGMAYLVRRLLENTSNESFLRSKFADGASNEKLLRDPGAAPPPALPSAAVTTDFANVPLLDFAIPDVRNAMTDALAQWRKRLGRTYPAVIGGRAVDTDRHLTRVNPAREAEVLGHVAACGPAEADLAVTAARDGGPAWARTSIEARAGLLERLADLMVERRFELAALQTLEVGKPWREADGDVAEAIDFCRYYARDARQLSTPRPIDRVPGESSFYAYRPRGVTVVIAPWNFPLAILTGMVAAAVVTGNTVVMKPAEQSSIIASELMRLLTEAGCPPGVVNFVPGLGEEVGDHLVAHRDVATICFTGSRAVGVHIMKRAAELRPGQTHLKRVSAELGGKNAIIIDSDADLDEAVTGVLHSAFGFAGQKCSACSRAIVLEPLYERFLSRLIEATRSVTVGDPSSPRTLIGPVVDAEARDRLQAAIQAAGTPAFRGEAVSGGFFVPPTIFRDVDPRSDLAQEELFGPVLAVIKAADIDQALAIANDTPYALTGGLYSRSPATIERVSREFEVGNLYVNRGITGALVDRHPFGGFKLSGLGAKTGGPDYLRQFTEPRVVTENTMRRGFVPTDE